MESSLSSSPLKDFPDTGDDHDNWLRLSLATGSSRSLPTAISSASIPLGQTNHTTLTSLSSTSPPSFAPPSPPFFYESYQSTTLSQEITATAAGAGPSRSSRTRRSPAQKLKPGKTDAVPAPYPWATTRRATLHSLEYLLSNNIFKISGEVQCRHCEKKLDIEYDLQEKFTEVASFISENKYTMHTRAPATWINPSLPDCKLCGQTNCLKPIITKKRSINWLFLLLGQLLGCLKLTQLKYFCKHTKNHRTGAKDRVLYLTYFGLCKQLDPNGPFDI